MKDSSKKYYSLRSFFIHMRTYRFWLVVTGISFAVSTVLITVTPYFIGQLVGQLSLPIGSQPLLWTYVWVLIGCSLLHDTLWRLSEVLYLRKLNTKNYAYESVLFAAVVAKNYQYFTDKFSGKISSYITLLGREYRDFITRALYEYIPTFFKTVAIVGMLATVNFATAGILVAGLLLMLLLGRILIRAKMVASAANADIRSTQDGYITDAIANYSSIIAFRKSLAEARRMAASQDQVVARAYQAYVREFIFWGGMSLVVRWMVWPATIVYNVWQFQEGHIAVAQMITLLTTIVVFSEFIWGLIHYVSEFATKLAYFEESHRYLFGTQVVRGAPTSKPHLPQPAVHSLDIGPLNFAYPDNPGVPVLRDITLSIASGEKVGIVGRSGGGKSTLFKILLGYYEISVGTLQINRQAVSSLELGDLVSYVPQDTALFHRSIGENIAYAGSGTATLEQIKIAAKQAHAAEFVEKLTQGYDTVVGERGIKLSIGQRQRIAIARAFLDDKPILLLDEATSALDSESEELVQRALETLWADKTVLAIAHRLSTLRHMDRIVVIENGAIVESGTHQQLIAADGIYAKLWAHQSGGMLVDE